MKIFSVRGGVGWVSLAIIMSIGFVVERCGAQDNSWTSPISGNWQDATWSLGVIPGTNQNVFLTNAGWKALQISASTALNFPQSFTVNSIVVSSPVNSFNTLLLNFADGTPFFVKTISVASNSAMTMLSSTLQINGPNGQGMTIGGKFDQNNSTVSGNQINVGYIGSGVYNLNSGTLAVSQLWVGGPYGGMVNQNGGTNAFGITHLEGGDYVLSNGFFGATIYFNGGQFQQEGGVLNSDLTLFDGTYVLDGGIHQGDTTVPSSDGFNAGQAGMQQSGGTNFGGLVIGYNGFGQYTLSGGLSISGGVSVGHQGIYNQSGGTQSISGMIFLDEQQVAADAYEFGTFSLAGGLVTSQGMSLRGYYEQLGGTNFLAGDVTVQGIESWLKIFGGLMTANNITANPGFSGGIFLEGGTLIITNQLQIGGLGALPDWRGFAGDSGQLVVSDISLTPQARFSCGNAMIVQSGTLTLANANLYAGSNSMHFGRLSLSNGGNANSTIFMPAGASVVNFADSSGIVWSNTVSLVVDSWSGSLSGGGPQQIVFGNNASALTAGQLAQIQFQNPAGLAPGTYSAKILASGEIVPNSGVVSTARLALVPQVGGMQLTLQGQPGLTYSVEVSTDLVHWAAFSNEVNISGTTTIIDTESTNFPARFYRARLLP